MRRWSERVVAHRRWVLAAWVLLAVLGAFSASRATGRLSYDFGLPGQPGYEANQHIVRTLGSGGDNAPVIVLGASTRDVAQAVPGARIGELPEGALMVYPRPAPGADAYVSAIPALQAIPGARVTGVDALADDGGGGGAGVLAETLFGGVGALVVLLLVFGSALAVAPLVIAVASILTTFLAVLGLTHVTDVSFIVQYLLALIGLGVAIDYSLLIVTRWREERGNGADPVTAVHTALATAGRSVLFSGVTVAVSLAALIALPVPFLRSVGLTGLLIPLLSVLAALTLLPALLVTAGDRLAWPHRRSADPESRLWRRVGTLVVRHHWLAAGASTVLLLALASPLLGLRLGSPEVSTLASTGGPAAVALGQVHELGAGLPQPVEVLTTTADLPRVEAAARAVPGIAGVLAPSTWASGDRRVVDVWTADDPASPSGSRAVKAVRTAARTRGAEVGGVPAQDADFLTAVYGNAWWVALLIIAVTFALLARALRSVVLPLKALLLNVVSLAAAYGITTLIWQHGVGTQVLFGQSASGAITVWVPVAVFAFLFGLSMDYEVFLLSRIREEHDGGRDTDAATVHGVARTGRLVTSAALILFLAFISLSRVPDTDVKILATALALGIIIDATVVRGVLAPALVSALGPANWWLPRRRS